MFEVSRETVGRLEVLAGELVSDVRHGDDGSAYRERLLDEVELILEVGRLERRRPDAYLPASIAAVERLAERVGEAYGLEAAGGLVAGLEACGWDSVYGPGVVIDGSAMSPAWRAAPHGEHVYRLAGLLEGVGAAGAAAVLLEAYEQTLERDLEAFAERHGLAGGWDEGCYWVSTPDTWETRLG